MFCLLFAGAGSKCPTSFIGSPILLPPLLPLLTLGPSAALLSSRQPHMHPPLAHVGVFSPCLALPPASNLGLNTQTHRQPQNARGSCLSGCLQTMSCLLPAGAGSKCPTSFIGSPILLPPLLLLLTLGPSAALLSLRQPHMHPPLAPVGVFSPCLALPPAPFLSSAHRHTGNLQMHQPVTFPTVFTPCLAFCLLSPVAVTAAAHGPTCSDKL
jgi:hypothetical protein